MTASPAPPDDGPRWYLGSSLLSLDLAGPFLADMGLEVTAPSRLSAIARSFVDRYQALDDDLDLDDDRRRSARQRLVTETIDRLTAELGPDAGRVVEWVMRTLPFEARSVAGPVVRRRILGRLGRTGGGPPEAALTPEGRETVARLVARYVETTADLRRRLREQRDSPPSTWDDRVLATSLSGADAMDWVADIAENVAAEATWDELTAALAPVDRAWLGERAREEATRMGARPDELDLQDPSAL